MKITGLKTYMVEAKRRNWVFLEVETDAGITGIGEMTVEMCEKATIGAVEDIAPNIIGENPLEIDRLWVHLTRQMYWRGDTILNSVISGIDLALWDIKGKYFDKPVYSLLGGGFRDRIPAYANYWFLGDDPSDYAKTVADYAKKAKEAVSKGWTALKWSPLGTALYDIDPMDEEVAVETVRRVREAVGDKVDLLIETHGRLFLPAAIRFANKIAPYHPLFMEEPLPPENYDAMRELKLNTECPLATGERLVTRFQFKEVLNRYAVDYIQPDLIHCGGISEMMKIAHMAEVYYTPIVPHNPCGPVATAACLHIAASIPNFKILEFIDVPDRSDVLVAPLKMENGYFNIPKGPGLGVELNKENIKKYPYSQKVLDHYKGSRKISMV